MNRRLFLVAAVAVCVVPLSSCSIAVRQALTTETAAAPAPVGRPSADVVAFCGPTTSNPAWRRQLATLADIGVTAVHGYCPTPPASYTVLEPGSRYRPQAEYLELATEARALGLGVVVYDPTFWTDPPAAATVWGSFIADGTLVAVDLGDEPSWADMPELARRAGLVRTTGATPQVIFVGSIVQNVVEQHRALPTACPISDDYVQNSAAMSDAFALRLDAGCAGIAIDTTGRDLDGNGNRWSTDQIDRAQTAGFRITLFTGIRPENYPTWDALVDDLGHITPAGAAVKGALA
jgi:hypothetical protein